MKYIKHRRVRDLEILDELEVRQILSSYPLLQLYRPAVVDGYKTYLKAKGAIPASHPVLPKQLCDAMKVHYENKVQSLEFIEDIRTKLSPGVCPMWGVSESLCVRHSMSTWSMNATQEENRSPYGQCGAAAILSRSA